MQIAVRRFVPVVSGGFVVTMLALAYVAFLGVVFADGRSSLNKVASEARAPGYKPEAQARYSRVVSAVDSTTGTSWVSTTDPTTSPPIVLCGGYTQVSVGGQAAVSTATITLRPWYEDLNNNTSDTLGPDSVWIPGSTITLSAIGTTVPGGTSGYYGMPKVYVDTDGCGRMLFEVVEITGGGAVRLFPRVN